MKKATTWDAADYLETEADIAAYLNAAFEDGDTSVIAAALGDVARAKGMTQLLSTIAKVKKHTNRNLTIDGILLTLVDGRTNLAKSTVR